MTNTLVSPVTATAVATTAQSEFNVQLTFVSDRNAGYHGIYAVTVLCWAARASCFSVPELLFELPQHIARIAWSPNGSHVALEVINQDGTSDIAIAQANDRELNAISSLGSFSSFPAWSPDGSKIVFTTASGAQSDQLMVVQLDPLEMNQLVLPANIRDPLQSVWSPDGRRIAFSAHAHDPYESEFPSRIYTISVDGTDATQITSPESGHGDISPAFSPDGLQLAYGGNRLIENSFWEDIYVVSLQSGEIVTVTSDSDIDLTPVWAPVGDWLAFSSKKTQDYEIYLIRPDGTDRLNISANSAKDISPAWRVVTN